MSSYAPFQRERNKVKRPYTLSEPRRALDWQLRPSITQSQPAPSRPAFRHLPLEDDQIRLLEFVPSETPQQVHCQLQHFRLQDRPSYTTISYQWGSPNVTQEIVIESATFHVNKNAARALQQLQKNSGDAFVWIDSVCIDQSNDAEKSEQVALMGKIYAGATETLVWLGSNDALLGDAFNALRAFSLLKRPGKADAIAVCHSIEPLLAHSYWSRLWVVQEILLSSSVTLVCGGLRLPWTSLDAFIGEYRAFVLLNHPWQPGVKETYLEALDVIHGMTVAKRELTGPSEMATMPFMPLHLLLHDYRHCRCSDSRDKIYGLLSIYESWNHSHAMPVLRPNYNTSKPDLVVIAAAHILEQRPSLDAMSVLGFLASLLDLSADDIRTWSSRDIDRQRGTNHFQLNLANSTNVQLPSFKVYAVQVGVGCSRTDVKGQNEGTFYPAPYSLLSDRLRRVTTWHTRDDYDTRLGDQPVAQDRKHTEQLRWESLQQAFKLQTTAVTKGDILCRPLDGQSQIMDSAPTLGLRESSSGELRVIGPIDTDYDCHDYSVRWSRGFIVPLDPPTALACALGSPENMSVDILPQEGHMGSLKSSPDWPNASEFDISGIRPATERNNRSRLVSRVPEEMRGVFPLDEEGILS